MAKKEQKRHEKYPIFHMSCPNAEFKDYMDGLVERALEAMNSSINPARGERKFKKYEAIRDALEIGVEAIEKKYSKKR